MSRQERTAEKILEKYREARELVESGQERAVAVVLRKSGGVKYRLAIRKGSAGIIHSLEIMEEDSTKPAVRIDLLGNWERALNSADYVLSNINMDDFREVAQLLLKYIAPRGGRTVREV
jgi:hypothetical protein